MHKYGTGRLIFSETVFGVKYEIYYLKNSVEKKGRKFRVYFDKTPARGSQWHYTYDQAMQCVEYNKKREYVTRIAFLETWVNKLLRENHDLRNGRSSTPYM